MILGTGARGPTRWRRCATQMGLDHTGLDVALLLRWLGNLVCAAISAGDSATYGVPVADLVGQRVLVSLPLALHGDRSVNVALAIPLGVLGRGAARTKLSDTLRPMGVAQIGVALPNFWFGLLLILLFAVTLPWLPASGFPGWESGAGRRCAHCCCPPWRWRCRRRRSWRG